jgi:hypothetical protein
MPSMTAKTWRKAADALIAGLNAFDTVGVQALFRDDAMIDDPSTGDRFERALFQRL